VTGTGTGSFATTLALSGLTPATVGAFVGLNDDSFPFYDVSATANRRLLASGLFGFLWPMQVQLCANGTSGAADGGTTSTIAVMPINGGRVTLNNGSGFAVHHVAEAGVRFSLATGSGAAYTADRNYDVFLQARSATATSADTGTEVITLAVDEFLETGAQMVPLTTAGGLTAGGFYYWRRITGTTGTLHPTPGDAIANTNTVNITATITTVFACVNIRLGAVWTNDTTRGTGIATLADDLNSGIYVYASNSAMVYVGTIRTISTTQTDDSAARRYVWSMYNRNVKRLFAAPGYVDNNAANTWTHNSATFTNVNAGGATADYQVGFVIGLAQRVQGSYAYRIAAGAGLTVGGLGVDGQVNPCTSQAASANENRAITHTHFFSTVGYHVFALMLMTTSTTATITGDRARTGNTADPVETFIGGEILA
jgi:hypothetical protein